MGKWIFCIGTVASIASFTTAIIQYRKDKRMELTVMIFVLSMAAMIGGATACVIGGEVRTRSTAMLEEAAAAAAAQAQADAEAAARAQPPVMYVSWDESIYHREEAAQNAEPAESEPESTEPAEELAQPPVAP